MKLNKFFEAQERLDSKVVAIFGLMGESLTNNVTMALYVELAELANEIEFFKHWKKNKRNNKDRQWDEWADCLHFMLSLGNKYGHSEHLDEVDGYAMSQLLNRELNPLFQRIYKTDFSDINEYVKAFKCLITIGWFIGMTTEDMEQAYFTKNTVNYERLSSGY